MSGANLLMALMYWKIEALFAMGLVNGIKTVRGARIVPWAMGALIVALTVGAASSLSPPPSRRHKEAARRPFRSGKPLASRLRQPGRQRGGGQMRKRDMIAWAALCAAPLIALAVAAERAARHDSAALRPRRRARPLGLEVRDAARSAPPRSRQRDAGRLLLESRRAVQGRVHARRRKPGRRAQVLWAAGVITAVMNTGIALALACSASSPG